MNDQRILVPVKWRDVGLRYNDDGELIGSDWRRGLPFANEVTLEVGDTIYWDDRAGWRGQVTAVHADGTIAWSADTGESDSRIDPRMFTVSTLAVSTDEAER